MIYSITIIKYDEAIHSAREMVTFHYAIRHFNEVVHRCTNDQGQFVDEDIVRISLTNTETGETIAQFTGATQSPKLYKLARRPSPFTD